MPMMNERLESLGSFSNRRQLAVGQCQYHTGSHFCVMEEIDEEVDPTLECLTGPKVKKKRRLGSTF